MNISLFYEEKGSKEPLILLHGNGEDNTYFQNQIEYFKDKYHVYAIDSRGHGKSPRGTAPLTIDQFVLDLNNFMISHDISSAIILGFSDGANTAMKFALRYPSKVKCLIINGGNLDTKGVKKTTQIPIEIGYRIAKLFAERSEKAKHNMEILGLMVNQPNIFSKNLSKINVPALIMAGTRDMIKKSHTILIADSIPSSKLVFIKGNHFIANKNPDEFNKVVNNFLISCYL